jgi:hypothetical protein
LLTLSHNLAERFFKGPGERPGDIRRVDRDEFESGGEFSSQNLKNLIVI